MFARTGAVTWRREWQIQDVTEDSRLYRVMNPEPRALLSSINYGG